MQEFDTALSRALTDPAHTLEQRRKALVEWANLPEARFAQPREEHLLPLHVVRLRPFSVRVTVCATSPERHAVGAPSAGTQAHKRAASAAAACGALEGPPVCLMQGCKSCIDCMTCITGACQTLDVPLKRRLSSFQACVSV